MADYRAEALAEARSLALRAADEIAERLLWPGRTASIQADVYERIDTFSCRHREFDDAESRQVISQMHPDYTDDDWAAGNPPDLIAACAYGYAVDDYFTKLIGKVNGDPIITDAISEGIDQPTLYHLVCEVIQTANVTL